LVEWRNDAYVLSLRLAGHPQQAEDVVQEAYLRVFRFSGRIPDGADGRKWLLKVVANVARELGHRDTRRRSREERSASMRCSDEHMTPEDSAVQAELRQALRDALNTLDAGPRAAISLHYEQGLSYLRGCVRDSRDA
jgi:RNA polymerase sigma-70 factor (ECF subfamily)